MRLFCVNYDLSSRIIILRSLYWLTKGIIPAQVKSKEQGVERGHSLEQGNLSQFSLCSIHLFVLNNIYPATKWAPSNNLVLCRNKNHCVIYLIINWFWYCASGLGNNYLMKNSRWFWGRLEIIIQIMLLQCEELYSWS